MFKCHKCGKAIKDSENGWHQIMCNKEQSEMRYTCAVCDISFASFNDYQKHICGAKTKMTREKAIELAKTFGNKYPWYEDSIRLLEALGLLKFDEEKKEVNELYSLKLNDIRTLACSTDTNQIVEKHGVIRLEECSEGLVLWVGGEIVYKSWRNKDALIKAEQVLKDRNEGTMYAYDLLYNTLDSLIKYIKGAG